MFREKTGIRGKVTAIVYEQNGDIKRHEPNLLQKFLGLPGNQMISINHNLVTNEGDAVFAQSLATTPGIDLPTNANAQIGVGTGYTATAKTTTGLTTPSGSYEAMDSTYPLQKGAFSATDDNVLVFKSTFEAGDLNASGIDEVALRNSSGDDHNIAYAQITPAINVTTADTLAITWEMTFLGA